MFLSKAHLNIDSSLGKLLRDRERMLNTLMSNLKGMVYCCLLDEFWTMVFVSTGCQQLTGYTAKDLLFNHRINYEAITLAEDRDWVRKKIDAALKKGEHFELEYRIVHADGSIRWVQETGGPLYNEDGHLVALEGFIQDVTRRKQSEEQAQAAEKRYQLIFENAISVGLPKRNLGKIVCPLRILIQVFAETRAVSTAMSHAEFPPPTTNTRLFVNESAFLY